jgi:hypothetical protein
LVRTSTANLTIKKKLILSNISEETVLEILTKNMTIEKITTPTIKIIDKMMTIEITMMIISVTSKTTMMTNVIIIDRLYN